MLAAALIFVVISATNTTTTHSATAFCETILSAMGVYDEHQTNKCVETAKVIYDDLKHAYDTN